MLKGLFLNNKKAKDSIYESGYMVYQCLLKSNRYALDYREVDITDREIPIGYDFYFFNYHPITMGWLQTRHLKRELGPVITMIMEVAPGDPFVFCPKKDFDFYCVLDPTINSKQENVNAFPRPLEKVDFELPLVQHEIPVIGSFGFATKGKGFQHVIDAVNREFEKAVVRINIPYGDFVPESEKHAAFLGQLCRQRAKPGIEVIITHDFMSKEALIKWCNNNTLNCFLYDRNLPGLSATTDQAIATGRPLSVSANDTFRHITAYLPPYPSFSLKDSIEKSATLVNRMKEDWQQECFTEKFELLLSKHLVKAKDHSEKKGGYYTLPIADFIDTIQKRLKKYKRMLKGFNLGTMITLRKKNEVI